MSYTFQNAPCDIQVFILTYLCSGDILKLSQLNRHWRDSLKTSLFWERLVSFKYPRKDDYFFLVNNFTNPFQLCHKIEQGYYITLKDEDKILMDLYACNKEQILALVVLEKIYTDVTLLSRALDPSNKELDTSRIVKPYIVEDVANPLKEPIIDLSYYEKQSSRTSRNFFKLLPIKTLKYIERYSKVCHRPITQRIYNKEDKIYK